MRWKLWNRTTLVLVGVLGLGVGSPSWADWSPKIEGGVYYTDDVSLFSASQRLSLQEDPTQPFVDVTDQDGDVVLEPVLTIGKSFFSGLGETTLSIRGQGFIFIDNPIFNHSTIGVRFEQSLPSEAKLGLRYHYGPNLFLGNNIERRSGSENRKDERVTTHFWSGTLEQEVLQDVRIRVLGRYGVRLYNDSFVQRDTHFWTVGPHIEWKVLPGVDLMLGYHFERGLAKGRNQPQFSDDISYINHYISSELEFELTKATFLVLAFHYERNDFTSNLQDDDRRNGNEDIFQGDFELRYHLADSSWLSLGAQRSQRKANFERSTRIDINTWIRMTYGF